MAISQLKLLQERFKSMRELTEKIVEPLETEDFVIQSVEDVSPPKWHLAHTTWFFEEFILKSRVEGYDYYLEDARKLFNSYYETISKPFPRSNRGLISRPTVAEVFDYRRAVDASMISLLEREEPDEELIHLMELGIQHEQQHQELLITDIKYNLSINPIGPAYHKEAFDHGVINLPEMTWTSYEEGLVSIGTNNEHFSFDNERPLHQQYVYAYQLADRPVSNGEFLAFMEDGGYETPEYWLSDGWQAVTSNEWKAPLYWEEENGIWKQFTLAGMKPIDLDAPVRHISFYEADAFARWAGARLPTEAEWEHALAEHVNDAFFLEKLMEGGEVNSSSFTGYVWEWTASPYVAYPQSARPEGALGEYNMKFMSNQMVLRGGSAYTPGGHIRSTYRNFFPAEKRWQCMGVRLAKNESRG